MKIGFARISSDDQNLDLQLDALRAAGCEKIFTEQITGSATLRVQLAAALEFIRPGDVLVVWKLDRLGRTTLRLVQLVHDLRERGIGFHSLTEGIDTTTPAGRFVFTILAGLAEMELELIRERTRAGLKAARARGRKGGRKALPNSTITAIRQLAAAPGVVVKDACKTLKISRATFYKYAQPDTPPG